MAIQALRINPVTLATVQLFQVEPTEYRPTRPVRRISDRPVTPAEYAAANIFTKGEGTLVEVNDVFDPTIQQRTEVSRDLTGGVFTITYSVTVLSTAQVRRNKRRAIKDEAASRAVAVDPDTFDQYEQIEGVVFTLRQIAGAAISLNADGQKIQDIRTAARAAIVVVNGLTGAALRNYDPVNDPAWPV